MSQEERSFEATLLQAARDYVELRDGDGEFNNESVGAVIERYFTVSKLKSFEYPNNNPFRDSETSRSVFFGLTAGEKVVGVKFYVDDYERVDFDKFAVVDLYCPLKINGVGNSVWNLSDNGLYAVQSNESEFGSLKRLESERNGSFLNLMHQMEI